MYEPNKHNTPDDIIETLERAIEHVLGLVEAARPGGNLHPVDRRAYEMISDKFRDAAAVLDELRETVR